jgi:hypothetical protein
MTPNEAARRPSGFVDVAPTKALRPRLRAPAGAVFAHGIASRDDDATANSKSVLAGRDGGDKPVGHRQRGALISF